MKTQHLIPILFLAGFCTVSAQTNNTASDSAAPLPASAGQLTEAQIEAMVINAKIDGITFDRSLDRCLELIQSNNFPDWQTALRTLHKQRQKIVRSLIATLDGQFPVDVKQEAARALGIYWAPEAMGSLINNLALDDIDAGYPHGIVSDDEMADLSQPPVTTALIKIGWPAVPSLVECIATNDAPISTGKCVSIISVIEGHDIAKVRLEQALNAESNPERKSRIQAALHKLEEVK